MRHTRTSRVVVTASLALTALAVSQPPAQAYCGTGGKWASHSTTIWTTTEVPASFDAPLQRSTVAWNGKGNWSFSYLKRGTYGPARNAVRYRTGSSLGLPANVPGVTNYTITSGSTIVDTTIYLNSSFTWNTAGVTDVNNHKADVQTVATHEIGHVLGLNHPSACGSNTAAENAAVMTPNNVKKYVPNSDDVAGLKALYG